MSIFEILIDIIYPPRCPLCEKVLPHKAGGKRIMACRECVRRLKLIDSPRCMKCGKQLDNMEHEYCGDCKKRSHSFERGAGAAAYSEDLRLSVHRFKYKCRREYAPFYAWLIFKQCESLIRQWDIDVIMPVPMHERKKKIRGYNQAELIAEELGKLTGIKVDSKALARTRNTQPMKELNDIERSKNLQNAFKMNNNVLEYKHILLVDDIYTTGCTIDACADVLHRAGTQKVYYTSLCIGNGF